MPPGGSTPPENDLSPSAAHAYLDRADTPPLMSAEPSAPIEGQLNPAERALLAAPLLAAPERDWRVLEVGTWLGGGSTVTFLRTLHQLGHGHLWGVEADRGIYERMIGNLRAAAPDAVGRFTPLFGFSQAVIPRWLAEQPADFAVDLAFLDGGNNPREQITEFRLLAPRIPVGGHLFSHDAKLRKGKWLVPYLRLLDNWECELHDVSDEGLFHARKLAAEPSPASLKAAQGRLFRMQLELQEIAAAAVPRRVCAWIFARLPARMVRRIADGRR